MNKLRASQSLARAVAIGGLLLCLMIAACGRREAVGDYPAANKNICLPETSLVDQHGATVSLASLKGKPVLIDFIYTSCVSTCPRLTAKMTSIARGLGPRLGAQVTIVSLTLDPEHDTAAELGKYATAQGADDHGWLFLTGTPTQVDQVLALFNLRRTRENDGSVTHSVSAFLLGADGRQIRQYNALDVSADAVVADVDRALGKS